MLVLLYYLDWNALHGLSGADCDGLRFGGGGGGLTRKKHIAKQFFSGEKQLLLLF